jgi:energy-coupling factor transport system ATP-binding protein
VKDIIDVQNVSFAYKPNAEAEQPVRALAEVSAKIERGQFVAVLGRNGSGKSTFARLLNALLLPDVGVVYIKGLKTADDSHIWEIRQCAGMIFQNPDNQIVGTIVEEDVAFGPENLGVSPAVIRERVDEAMKLVGIKEFAKHAPHLLSGGQKQRVAIAGILAMKPECIILDEATSMLDPIGRKEVINVLKKLNKEDKITIIHITHHMDEASLADRVIVIDNGRLVSDGTPRDVFNNVEKIKHLGLDVPQVTELIYELDKEGFSFPLNVLTVDEAYGLLVEAIEKKQKIEEESISL